jgi:Ca2+-transporting ATPase
MFYQKPIKSIFHELESRKEGLSPAEAKKKLAVYGLNELKQEKHFTILKIFFSQFTDPIVIVLICATLLSLFLKEFTDAYVIGAIIILNALLGFFQEYRAERSIQMLSKLSSPTAKVLRNNIQQIIPANQLVPGDIILLES